MTIETSLGEFKSKFLESCINTIAVTIQLAGIFGVIKEFRWPVKKSWIFNLKAFFKIESCPVILCFKIEAESYIEIQISITGYTKSFYSLFGRFELSRYP